MILSRFPIVRTDYHRFSDGFGDDAEAKRGIIYAQIKIKDSDARLNVFTVHTQCDNYLNPAAF
jgi:hypothetical protein